MLLLVKRRRIIHSQKRNSILTKNENHLGKKEALAHRSNPKIKGRFLIDYYFKPLTACLSIKKILKVRLHTNFQVRYSIFDI